MPEMSDTPAHCETLYLIGLLLPLMNPDPAVDVAWRMNDDQRVAYNRLAARVEKYS